MTVNVPDRFKADRIEHPTLDREERGCPSDSPDELVPGRGRNSPSCGTVGAYCPPGLERNERKLAVRHWTAHRVRTTAHARLTTQRILDFELA